jgi:toluene monooxygenase electron transfer component
VELDRPATFLPGQYAIVQLGSGVRRCYSMTNLPGERTVTFVLRREPGGEASPLLTQLPLGSPLHVELPYGRAYLRDPVRPLVLLAGGTGIAPMLSILRALAFQHRADCPPVTLFYGARNVASLVELATIRELLGALPQGALHLAISDPDPDWDGPSCSILQLFEQWTTDWSSRDYYLRGPPGLVDAARRLLLARSVPITRIHADPFG